MAPSHAKNALSLGKLLSSAGFTEGGGQLMSPARKPSFFTAARKEAGMFEEIKPAEHDGLLLSNVWGTMLPEHVRDVISCDPALSTLLDGKRVWVAKGSKEMETGEATFSGVVVTFDESDGRSSVRAFLVLRYQYLPANILVRILDAALPWTSRETNRFIFIPLSDKTVAIALKEWADYSFEVTRESQGAYTLSAKRR